MSLHSKYAEISKLSLNLNLVNEAEELRSSNLSFLEQPFSKGSQNQAEQCQRNANQFERDALKRLKKGEITEDEFFHQLKSQNRALSLSEIANKCMGSCSE